MAEGRAPLDPACWQRVAELFDELAELQPAPRALRLSEIAAADPELAAALAPLLAADARGGPLDADIALDALADELTPAEPPPERAGPFRIVGLLGRGGMADVFAAERDDGAFEQSAAIKVLRRGLDTADLLARFLRERSILARLEHPAIARLLDGGTLADGRPYLVMERVDGEPIHHFVERRRLGVEERLRLLLVACDAVAYAHRNLVVHRDLKPSNVLVSDGGASGPQVKLLDFGIAKILSPDGERGRTTREVRLLTPAYAAPEQLAGEPTTTATDVWGLGALAFELLVSEPPLAQSRRSGDPLASALAPPPRASSRALEIGGDGAGSRRWAARLRGDLDTIVGKALAVDPGRRYPSAEAFADDLRRHLDGRPVGARPHSLGYRVGKFVRRHRLGVAAAVLVALSLVAGVTVATWQAHEARRERDVAERARVRNEKLIDFMLGDLQEKLEPSNRLDVVADLAGAVLKSLDAIPPIERTKVSAAQRARVLAQLAAILQFQGDPKQAEARLRQAIAVLVPLASGPASPPEAGMRLAEARTELVRVLSDQGDPVAATAAAHTAIRGWRALVAARPQDPEQRVGLAHALNEAGRVFLVAGHNLDARQSHLEAIALFDALPPAVRDARDVGIDRLNARLYAGRTLESTGEFEAASDQLRIAIAQATALSNANPKDNFARHQVSIVTNDMGRVLRKTGRLAEAAATFTRALAITEEVVARDPGNLFFRSDLSACHAFLGRVHEMQGSLDVALAEFHADVTINEALIVKQPDNGSWQGFLADALTNEGRALMGLSRLDEAMRAHQRALTIRERSLRETADDAVAQADVAESLLERGRVRTRVGLPEAAKADWKRAGELLTSALRTSDYQVHRIRFARTLLELGDVNRARPVVERLLSERCNSPELLELARKWKLAA
ncbi:MAG TPA: protein kinase [Thermoanaerobaculia bacterium]|jgi:serine/threonine-protein kinase|nr:protein kinase [Thermoanaerobaculia bacterium]